MDMQLSGTVDNFDEMRVALYRIIGYIESKSAKCRRLPDHESALSVTVENDRCNVDFQIGYGLIEPQEIDQEEAIPLFTPHEDQLALLDVPA